MLNKSPGRNQRAKGCKVKHVLHVILVLAICIWLLYQVKHTYEKKKAYDDSTGTISEKVHSQHEIVKLGRKDLHPGEEETVSMIDRHEDKDELEEVEEIKLEESEDEGRGGGDDEIDGHDQEKVEDLVDEDDRERERASEEQESEENRNQVEDTKLLEDQGLNEGEKNTQEAKEEHYKDADASSANMRNARSLSAEFGARGLRWMKQEGVESTENIGLEQKDKKSAIAKDIMDVIGSGLKEGNMIRHGIEYKNSTEAVANNEQEIPIQTSSSPNETDIFPGSVRKVNVTSNAEHVSLQAVFEELNRTASEESNIDSILSKAINNLEAINRDLGLETTSESVVPERSLKLGSTTATDRSLVFTIINNNGEAVANVEQSSSSFTRAKNLDAVQNE